MSSISCFIINFFVKSWILLNREEEKEEEEEKKCKNLFLKTLCQYINRERKYTRSLISVVGRYRHICEKNKSNQSVLQTQSSDKWLNVEFILMLIDI